MATKPITIYAPGGIQGSSYNPQQTAPVKYVQNAAPTSTYQPAATGTSVQGGNASFVQNASAISAAAETQRIALAQEVARQKEARRVQVQGALDGRVAANTATIKLKASSTAQKIAIGRRYYPGKITVPKYSPEDPEYQKIKDKAMRDAMKLVDGMKSDPSTGKLDKFVDKVTFGSDRRASGARKWAEKQATAVSDKQIKVYQGKLDAHNKLQAKLQADYEAKKLTLPPTELNAIADQYNALLSKSVADLKHVEAYTVGTVEGYGQKAGEKLHSTAANAVGFVNRNVIQKAAENPLWKYSLGSGSENIPSVVTAPSRVINWAGNINTKDRQIYKYGGDSENRVTSGKNAWQSTFNQRNVNLRPVVDKPYTWSEAKKVLDQDVMAKKKFEAINNPKDKDKFARKFWEQHNTLLRNQNSAKELAADPLNLLGGAGAGSRGITKVLSKGAEVGRTAKYTSKAFAAADKFAEFTKTSKSKLAQNKIVKWLGAEHKSPEQALQDAIDAAKKNQGAAQQTLLPRLASIDKKLSGGKIDFSIFDDFAGLSDSEAKVLQRMRSGKLTATDRLMLAGKDNQHIRDTLERISSKWDNFAEDMRLADRVETTRFGKGKQTYSPRTVWTQGDLKQYNFRLRRKKGIQNADDFAQGAVDRYLKSDLRNQKKMGNARLEAERSELVKRYDATLTAERAQIEKLYKRTKSPLNQVRKAVGAPVRVWKKSVLKYRPAWTVNNVLYNTQAGALSAGAGFIPEQLKMLNPRYARKAMDEVPSSVKTDLAKEIGTKGKLNKFYAGVENKPRVAAFRALKKKGFSDAEALKRVDKYFFNYKTKNWERPLKTAMPFWAWQKNLTKAAVQMPFDRPGAAIAYNRLDRHQQQAFEKDFETMVPQLKEYGYSDSEIEAFKQEQAKYYAGRLKVGSKYITTPFNAFSEKGLTSMGFNPYLAAAGESAESVDSYGRKTSGNESSLIRRLTTKFPQAELGYKRYKSVRVDKGLDKPSMKYIGKEGSEGYGLTKEKQGYDSSKANYVASMDPRTKTKQDLSAFVGKPREIEFDKSQYLKGKKLQKVTAEYFSKATAWKDMDFDQAETERKEFFKEFGLSPDDFYKGVLAKYDTDHTKKIKGLKEDAAAKNKSLFAEYAAQPKGTRNVWATKKLRELTKAGYFNDNPFLKSFNWINSETAAKADRQSSFQAVGYKRKSSPYKVGEKHFKSAESMAKYKEGEFWKQYADASKSERKSLLAKNPQFNRRANWTNEQWDAWKLEDKAKKVAKLRSWGNAGELIDKHLAENRANSLRYTSARTIKRRKKRIAYA